MRIEYFLFRFIVQPDAGKCSNCEAKRSTLLPSVGLVHQMTGKSTRAIHGHGYYDKTLGVFKLPIYQTVVFEHPEEGGVPRKGDRGFDLKYSREENPTVRGLERTIAELEEAPYSLAFSNGMSGISTLYLSSLQSGDTVLIGKESYGVTQELALDLSRFGIKTIFGGPETDALIERIDRNVRMVVVETMTNPLLRVLDINRIARRCKETGSRLVVDGTFTTPLLYRPLKNGAWVSLHSTTKYLSGHNDSLGGVVSINSEDDLQELWSMRRKVGSIITPFEAFLCIRGLATLEARFEAQSRTALKLANFLSSHPRIKEVFYPGLKGSPYRKVADRLFERRIYGGVLSFKVKGGQKKVMDVMKKTKVIKPAPSLGGVESLLTYPLLGPAMTMSEKLRQELGIDESLMRLSVGLEDEKDLEADLDAALRSS